MSMFGVMVKGANGVEKNTVVEMLEIRDEILVRPLGSAGKGEWRSRDGIQPCDAVSKVLTDVEGVSKGDLFYEMPRDLESNVVQGYTADGVELEIDVKHLSEPLAI